jgi:hypothetical protein
MMTVELNRLPFLKTSARPLLPSCFGGAGKMKWKKAATFFSTFSAGGPRHNNTFLQRAPKRTEYVQKRVD